MATNTAVDVVMPQMGVSVSEGTITKWSKQVGETIEADETLLEISTDKVDTEVPSPASGVVSEILVQEGETVEVGTVLARIGGEAGRRRAARRCRARAAARARARAASPLRQSSHRRPRRRLLLRRACSHRRGTDAHSSRPSWRGSQPSTASTRARFPGPATAAA